MKPRLILLLLTQLFSANLFACSCGEVSLQDKINSSDYIYHGRVIESKLIDKNMVSNKLLVIEKIKGYPQTHNLKSYLGEYNMCKMYVVTGVDYVVFGNVGKTPVISSVCSKSYPIFDNIEKYIKEIRTKVKTG